MLKGDMSRWDTSLGHWLRYMGVRDWVVAQLLRLYFLEGVCVHEKNIVTRWKCIYLQRFDKHTTTFRLCLLGTDSRGDRLNGSLLYTTGTKWPPKWPRFEDICELIVDVWQQYGSVPATNYDFDIENQRDVEGEGRGPLTVRWKGFAWSPSELSWHK
jgi:hypothetical protein